MRDVSRPFAGIFVGGKSSRMGGRAKGLLPAPDGRPLVLRLAAVVGPLAEVLLVGEGPEYAALGFSSVADDPPGIGPLGGLLGLLRHAKSGPVLAIACDMPRVSTAVVEALLGSPAAAPIVAPRRDGRWEPLLARYDAARVVPVAMEQARRGTLSLQRLLDAAGAVALPADAYDPSVLEDWDSPEDVRTPRIR
jgi:molybdopterin-guanine dinucleotide biosynthesis protein A